MELREIKLNENKTDKMYDSLECQQLLKMCDEFYPKVGFNFPWISYFVLFENRIVGSCSFIGQPKEGKIEIAYWTYKPQLLS